MTIPSVVQGLIETEDGKVFELDSPKGSAWLESIGSFRFEPSGDSKPYTVRKESGIYWYGCRKVAGKVRKKYIGKSSEVSIAKLEEIAEALETPPVPRVDKVVEVAEEVAEVAETSTDRLTALELQVANLQKALEALQETLPGKLESGDSLGLPKVDNEVVERLQNQLGNLQAENRQLKQDVDDLMKSHQVAREASDNLIAILKDNCRHAEEKRDEARANYATLLESSTAVTNKLRGEVQELRSQLERERADREEIEVELSDLRKKSATASELPEAADLLNRLKAQRKKSKADLADMDAVMEILGNLDGLS
jgi:chromosome segregation ATPase